MAESLLKKQIYETIRLQNKSDKTAKAYWDWVYDFLLFARQKRGQWVHPTELRERQVEIYLKHLANNQNVSANTQNQAFSALCFSAISLVAF
jgi:site-specific recombinase XerD